MVADIQQTVESVIEDVLQIDDDGLDGESTFQNDLGAESIQMVEIAELTKREVDGVDEIPDEDLADLETVAEFTDYVGDRAAREN